MERTSRISGFYKMSLDQRHSVIAQATDTSATEIALGLQDGGIDASTADKCVENVLGTYALPYGVALNVRVNARDYVVPMVVEEPSVIAAASNSARMIRLGGGFEAEADPPLMIAQVQLIDVQHEAAAERIFEHSDEILELANRSLSGLVLRGGGARRLQVRSLGAAHERMTVVHIVVDCRDAMGANLVNTAAEAVAGRLAELAQARVGLRILTNLSDQRCVRVRCRVPAEALATDTFDGRATVAGIVNASRFAELDPYRAATHNKGIMNGVDAVVLATGNDWRAVEAGAHAFAARSSRYAPLATWRCGNDGALEGSLEMPLALGCVGGTLRVHPAARLSLRLMGIQSATELALVAASVGMASNLAALRALATDGIQRGHMALHARSVAVAAGASGEFVESVAALIVQTRNVTIAAAQAALAMLTDRTPDGRVVASKPIA
jgi:hydroxymethylglutaryl-CoA reductase